jgi:predicted transcriptional regulator
MSKRLQVVLDDREYGEIQRIARRQRMNVSEWVRQALRRARRSEPGVDSGRKLEAIRSAFEHEFPTAEIERMLEEIERGYLGERDPPSR